MIEIVGISEKAESSEPPKGEILQIEKTIKKSQIGNL